MDWTVTSPDSDVPAIEEAYKALRKPPENHDGTPVYTDAEWVQKFMEDQHQQNIKRGRTVASQETAKVTTQAEPERITRTIPDREPRREPR